MIFTFLFDIDGKIAAWIISIICIVSLSFLYIASKVTVYKHKFGTHPSSFIAQTEVFGKKNTKSVILFNIWAFLLMQLNILIINLIEDNFLYFRKIHLLVAANIGATLAVIWMASIPINISRIGHLGGVLSMVAFYTFENILFVIFFINMCKLKPWISYWTLAPAIIELLLSTIYIAAYFNDLREKRPPPLLKPGLWQKFWIIAFSYCQMIYAIIFCYYFL